MLAQDIPTLQNFINDLRCENIALIKSRNALRAESIAATVKEINQKYNAVASLFVKEYGESPIRRDGYLAHFKAQFSEPWLDKLL